MKEEEEEKFSMVVFFWGLSLFEASKIAFFGGNRQFLSVHVRVIVGICGYQAVNISQDVLKIQNTLWIHLVKIYIFLNWNSYHCSDVFGSAMSVFLRAIKHMFRIANTFLRSLVSSTEFRSIFEIFNTSISWSVSDRAWIRRIAVSREHRCWVCWGFRCLRNVRCLIYCISWFRFVVVIVSIVRAFVTEIKYIFYWLSCGFLMENTQFLPSSSVIHVAQVIEKVLQLGWGYSSLYFNTRNWLL